MKAVAPSDPNSPSDAPITRSSITSRATPRDHTPLQPMGEESTALKLNIMFVMFKSVCTVGRSPRFAYCGWTRDHMSDLAKALPRFKKLRILNLNCNDLKDEGAEVLASALKATCVLCCWRRHRQPIQRSTPGIVCARTGRRSVVERKRSAPLSEVRSSSCVVDRASLMKLWFVEVLGTFITGAASDVIRDAYTCFYKCYLILVRLEGKVFRQLCGVSGVLVNSSKYCLGDRVVCSQGRRHDLAEGASSHDTCEPNQPSSVTTSNTMK